MSNADATPVTTSPKPVIDFSALPFQSQVDEIFLRHFTLRLDPSWPTR